MNSELKYLLARQEKLAEVLSDGKRLRELEGEERVDAIRTTILALEDELHEVLLGVGWKPWATSRHVDEEITKHECVDVLFFWLQLAALLHLDAYEILRIYGEKYTRNIERHTQGYDGVTGKCKSCGQSFDDDGVECNESWCMLNEVSPED